MVVTCDRCGRSSDPFDNYCRHCGAALSASPLPARAGDLSLIRLAENLPQRWPAARPSLWQGLAALVIGTAVELARREMVRRLHTPPGEREISGSVMRNPMAFPESVGEERGDYELREVFYFRRIIRRRG